MNARYHTAREATARAGRVEPAFQIHDAEHRLQRGGEHRFLGAPAHLLLAAPEPQAARRDPMRAGPAGEVLARDQLGAARGEHAHRLVRAASASRRSATTRASTASPRKASALVVALAGMLVRVGAVGERLPQEGRVPEGVAEAC